MNYIKNVGDDQNKYGDTSSVFQINLVKDDEIFDFGDNKVTVNIANKSGYILSMMPEKFFDNTVLKLDFNKDPLKQLTPDYYRLEVEVLLDDGDVAKFPTNGGMPFNINKSLKDTQGELVPTVTFDTVLEAVDQKVANYLATVAKGDKGDKGDTGVVDTTADYTWTGENTFNKKIIAKAGVQGNADTATKLQTARRLGGQLFDGTSDVTLPGVNATGNQDTSGHAASADVSNKAVALKIARRINGTPFDGTSDITVNPVVNFVNTETDVFKLSNGFYYFNGVVAPNKPAAATNWFTVEVMQTATDGFMRLVDNLGLSFWNKKSDSNWSSWKKDAEDSTVVHNTGNEEVSGIKVYENAIYSRNKIPKKMISVTIASYMNVSDSILDTIKRVGASISLVVMVPVQSLTDSSPVPDDLSMLINFIKRVQAKNIKIDMLKPHLGDTDNFSRYDYNPSNYDTFFGIWGNYLEKLADLCNKNNIDILSIGCEQFQNTKSIHEKYWLDIINNLHAKFNNVRLTYAFSLYEFKSDDNLSISKYLDYIGFNVYPSLTSELYNDNMTVLDTASGWYSSPSDGFSFDMTIKKIRDKYNKKIIITECGATPYTYAINQSYSTGYPVDYKALALYIETIFYVVSRIENIIGIAWWHGETNGPFTFWSESETTLSETKMKEMIERY